MTELVIAAAGEGVFATGMSFEIREWTHGPSEGPPLHMHQSDDEAWHVLDGVLTFRFSDRTVDAGAGARSSRRRERRTRTAIPARVTRGT